MSDGADFGGASPGVAELTGAAGAATAGAGAVTGAGDAAGGKTFAGSAAGAAAGGVAGPDWLPGTLSASRLSSTGRCASSSSASLAETSLPRIACQMSRRYPTLGRSGATWVVPGGRFSGLGRCEMPSGGVTATGVAGSGAAGAEAGDTGAAAGPGSGTGPGTGTTGGGTGITGSAAATGMAAAARPIPRAPRATRTDPDLATPHLRADEHLHTTVRSCLRFVTGAT